MDNTPAQTAISLALAGKWEDAVNANLEVLKDSPEDVDSLNRLSRAYAELGKIEKARDAAKKALLIDPVNPIATKCIEKLKSAKKGDFKYQSVTSSESYLEEPGKTKIVTLMNPGTDDIIGGLDCGDSVKLLASSHRVSVVTDNGKYIGRLSDDLAARLIHLIKGGNKYQTLIKSIEPKEVTVFIREIEKGLKSPNISSFPTEKIDYVSFTPPELIHKDAPDNEATEEIAEV